MAPAVRLPDGIRDAKARIRPAYRRMTLRSRVLPDFVIIGAQKAGTTSLIRYLRSHPDVALEPGVGEVHFFDIHWSKGESYYRSHFRRASSLERSTGGKRAITGEKTPYYLYHPLSPARAAATIPKARLIALLRNPSERAASHHKMNVNMGNEPLSLAEAIEAEPGRIDAAFQGIIDGTTPPGAGPVPLYSYVARGRYAEQLDRWLEHFPREQLLVLRSEDLLSDPEDTYARVLDFLDLDVVSTEFERHNAARKPYSVDAEVRVRLDELFDEPNRRLAAEYGISW
jgi:hypothetical protein